jgi:hypothetical protein
MMTSWNITTVREVMSKSYFIRLALKITQDISLMKRDNA